MPKLKKPAVIIAAGLFALQYSLVLAAPTQLSLQDSVNLALKNNPAIQISQQDQEKSQWGVTGAQAADMPNLSLGSSYNLKSGESLDQGSTSNSLRLNWQLYNGGGSDAQISQAKLGVDSAKHNVDKTKQQVKLDTITAYYNVLLTTDLQTVAQETADNLKSHLDIVQANYNAGTVAKSDVLRSDVEVTNAEQNLIKAQNARELALANLRNEMSMPANADIQLSSQLAYQQDARTLDDALATAKKNNPDLAIAKTNVDSAAQGVKSAESDRLPTIGLSASDGLNNNLSPNDGNWSVGLSASWNIFDGGVTKSKIGQANSSLDKAKLQAQQADDSLAQLVRQDYLNMREAEQRLQTTEVAVSQAQEDLKIAQEKYQAGVGTNLDVIDAQLALTQAETNHIQALYDYNVNQAKLDNAVGTPAEAAVNGGK